MTERNTNMPQDGRHRFVGVRLCEEGICTEAVTPVSLGQPGGDSWEMEVCGACSLVW